MPDGQKDVQAYLARIRKTIAESEALVSQVDLRIAETDRMLERNGLTREQVLNLRFSAQQREAVNEELRRRGFEPFDAWEEADLKRELESSRQEAKFDAPEPVADGELAERQRKFSMMMKPFQI